MIEQELQDTNESLSNLTCQNQSISGAKMKCEQEMHNLRHDMEEMTMEAKMSDEKAQKAMIDAARLAEELRAEQEAAMMLERDKKLLEVQMKDSQCRLDDAEQAALKGGKKAIAKMETRLVSANLSLSLMLRTDAVEMLPRISASLRDTSRNSPSLWMRTKRTLRDFSL